MEYTHEHRPFGAPYIELLSIAVEVQQNGQELIALSHCAIVRSWLDFDNPVPQQQSVSGEVNQSGVNIRDLSAKILEQAAASEQVGSEIDQLSQQQKKLVNQFKV